MALEKNIEMNGASADDGVVAWRNRIIFDGQMAPPVVPDWLDSAYETLRVQVMHPKYPCFFGTLAEKKGEMFYSFVQGKDISHLPATMRKFAELSVQPAYEKNNIAIFFEPDQAPLSHQQYHDHFWHVLQYLHNHDSHPEVLQHPDPNEPSWEFTFSALQMFVVCACPSFKLRHSRNLGPGMVLLFQPRSVFVDKVTNRVIGVQARNEVRRRLLTWDAIPAHPDLGFYGDPGNLEWKQYFLPDENEAATDRCPFLSRRPSKFSEKTNEVITIPSFSKSQETALAAPLGAILPSFSKHTDGVIPVLTSATLESRAAADRKMVADVAALYSDARRSTARAAQRAPG